MKLATRLRRARANDFSRRLVKENHLSVNDFIYPLFITDSDSNEAQEIETMPGIFRHSLKSLLAKLSEVSDLSIPAIALFPSIHSGLKNAKGSEASNPKGLIPTAIRKIKSQFPNLGIIADVALDPYTSHGHDGLIDEKARVVNDLTVSALKQQALVLADSGADVVAPSDMMDGRIGVIRNTLEKHNFKDTLILSYAAKYASSFYGPFRDAVGSKVLNNSFEKTEVNKKTYQMDFCNSDEAMSEVELDILEGADWLMVKPGIFYLDILYRVKNTFQKPTFVYQVSGEYAMLKFADKANALNYENNLIESLTCFKRAGANGIFTYGAVDAAKILLKQ